MLIIVEESVNVKKHKVCKKSIVFSIQSTLQNTVYIIIFYYYIRGNVLFKNKLYK